MALRHNSETREDEPQWSEWLGRHRAQLPDTAFEDGRWTDGEMYLHRGGLNAAWAAAMGARSGQRAAPEVIDHLRQHRRALGLEDDEGADAVSEAEGDSPGVSDTHVAQASAHPSIPLGLSLPHVATRLFHAPLAIEPNKLRAILAAVGPRFGIPARAQDDPFPPRRRPPYEVVNGTAVIPVFGTLVQRASGMEALSGLTSYERLGHELAQAMADPQVRRVLLEIDSPGGEVAGLYELVAQIRAMRQQKPIHALANAMAASAAYLIGSAATRFYVTPEAVTGSIGVVYLHVDATQATAKEGFLVTEIFAGRHKVDTSPYRALAPDARAQLQRYVNTYYDQFVGQVATLRQLEPDDVRATEAALYIGKDAVAIGLVDGVRLKLDVLANPEEEDTMERTPSRPAAVQTAADLRAAYPEVISEIEASARQAERTRVKQILALAVPATRATAEQLALEQDVSPEQAAVTLIGAMRTQARVEAFTQDGPPLVPFASGEGETPDPETAAVIASARRIAEQRQARGW